MARAPPRCHPDYLPGPVVELLEGALPPAARGVRMARMSQQPHTAPDAEPTASADPGKAPDRRVIVVGPDGQPVGVVQLPAEDDDGEQSVADLVEHPAKVMRIGSMIKQLLEEVRNAPLDEASRVRLRDIHRRSITELESGLAPELVDELERLSLPFEDGPAPSESELRIAQAQLVGWLEGLFHGIQTALFAQQMNARAQFEQMRRALPGGPGGGEHPGAPRPGAGGSADGEHGGGLYL